jgi:hypothetical protein
MSGSPRSSMRPRYTGRVASKGFGRLRLLHGVMSDLQDPMLDTESLFAAAIREHLDLKARNSGLDGDMPLEPYLEDTFENHPLFKSEEQARIEETLDGEPADEATAERQLPWPGEETAESAEGAALDETLWTGRPRDFDWGD